jgi:TRAP transporter 4TM/12TM fusion protein
MFADYALTAICILWLGLQLTIRFIFPVNPLIQRYMFLAFSFIVFFYPFGKYAAKRLTSPSQKVVEVIIFCLSVVLGIYFIANSQRFISRWEFIDPVFLSDIVITVLMLIIMLEANRRIAGRALPLFTLIMIAYGHFSHLFPGFFNHEAISLGQAAEVQMMSTVGVFGIAAGVCVEYVFYFVLFGALYEAFGGGDLLTKLGLLFTKRSVGGPAKSAVIASSLMGAVSGSAVANVTATGTFTIPLMKRTGVSPEVAGAIEAAASTGGQLMPPVMGAGAFILAETLGIPYLNVVKAAILPAVCYYVALFFFVHFYSKKRRTAKKEVISLSGREIVKKLHLLFPLLFMVYLIIIGRSVGLAVLWSIASLIVIGTLFKHTRLSFGRFIEAVVGGMRQSASVGLPIFITGVTIGVAIHSGIAMKATNLIVSLGSSMLLPSLFLGIAVCVILGMGLPTSAAYVVASLFVAPALIKNGVNPLAAHLFIFYYAILAQITPPVAVTAYAGAGIAESNPVRTGWIAFGLSFVAFLIPFTFVFNQGILMEGPLSNVLYAFVTTALGSLFLSLGLSGYAKTNLSRPIRWFFRVVLIVSAILLINSTVLTDITGIVLAAGVLGYDYLAYKRQVPDGLSV